MKTYEHELNKIVSQIMASTDMSLMSLARASGLSYPTVWRLSTFQTRLPRLKTVMLLAKAVGMTLDLVPTKGRRKKAS